MFPWLKGSRRLRMSGRLGMFFTREDLPEDPDEAIAALEDEMAEILEEKGEEYADEIEALVEEYEEMKEELEKRYLELIEEIRMGTDY